MLKDVHRIAVSQHTRAQASVDDTNLSAAVRTIAQNERRTMLGEWLPAGRGVGKNGTVEVPQSGMVVMREAVVLQGRDPLSDNEVPLDPNKFLSGQLQTAPLFQRFMDLYRSPDVFSEMVVAAVIGPKGHGQAQAADGIAKAMFGENARAFEIQIDRSMGEDAIEQLFADGDPVLDEELEPPPEPPPTEEAPQAEAAPSEAIREERKAEREKDRKSLEYSQKREIWERKREKLESRKAQAKKPGLLSKKRLQQILDKGEGIIRITHAERLLDKESDSATVFQSIGDRLDKLFKLQSGDENYVRIPIIIEFYTDDETVNPREMYENAIGDGSWTNVPVKISMGKLDRESVRGYMLGFLNALLEKNQLGHVTPYFTPKAEDLLVDILCTEHAPLDEMKDRLQHLIVSNLFWKRRTLADECWVLIDLGPDYHPEISDDPNLNAKNAANLEALKKAAKAPKMNIAQYQNVFSLGKFISRTDSAAREALIDASDQARQILMAVGHDMRRTVRLAEVERGEILTALERVMLPIRDCVSDLTRKLRADERTIFGADLQSGLAKAVELAVRSWSAMILDLQDDPREYAPDAVRIGLPVTVERARDVQKTLALLQLYVRAAAQTSTTEKLSTKSIRDLKDGLEELGKVLCAAIDDMKDAEKRWGGMSMAQQIAEFAETYHEVHDVVMTNAHDKLDILLAGIELEELGEEVKSFGELARSRRLPIESWLPLVETIEKLVDQLGRPIDDIVHEPVALREALLAAGLAIAEELEHRSLTRKIENHLDYLDRTAGRTPRSEVEKAEPPPEVVAKKKKKKNRSSGNAARVASQPITVALGRAT